MDKLPEIRRGLYHAVDAGDAQSLLVILNSAEGNTISGTEGQCLRQMLALAAAKKGDTQCLRVLGESGFVPCTQVWALAAYKGHVNCLHFAVSHGYALDNRVLDQAVCYGHLGCVEFLLEQGLPREPYVHSLFRTSPSQLECLQMMLDKGVAINPQTLILAASRGDVDFVRWLHQRGVPLWREARDARHKSLEYVDGDPMMAGSLAIYQWQTVKGWPEPPGRIAIPKESCEREAAPAGIPARRWSPCGLEDTWKALRYGAVFGAPVTRRAERFFARKRERTHAVLLCFKAAARLRAGRGRAKQRRVWAGMAALPSCLVDELLILADLEIPETVVMAAPTAL